MNKRVISAAAAVPVIYLFILWGGFPFFILTGGVIIAGLIEFYNMCSEKKLAAVSWWGVLLGAALLLNAYLITAGTYIVWGKDPVFLIFTFGIMGLMIIIILQREINEAVIKAGVTLVGLLYIVWLGSHIIFLRDIEPFGFKYTLMAFILTWAADIGAYYTGLNFGKKGLHIASPNKSRAGVVGAVIFGAAAGAAVKYILGLEFISVSNAVALGALIGIFAVLGDLAESVLKRNCGFKDSGVFLPGHGGVLDRIDSILFTVPVVYYYLHWLIL